MRRVCDAIDARPKLQVFRSYSEPLLPEREAVVHLVGRALRPPRAVLLELRVARRLAEDALGLVLGRVLHDRLPFAGGLVLVRADDVVVVKTVARRVAADAAAERFFAILFESDLRKQLVIIGSWKGFGMIWRPA